MTNNLLGMPETRLAEDPDVLASIANPEMEASDVVIAHPTSSLAWARVGYHRGLDALRKGGWKGQGPVPWSHVPNQGVLRALYALKRGADAIGEEDEVERLDAFLRDADPKAIRAIEAEEDERRFPE
jgi:hypothetical protein